MKRTLLVTLASLFIATSTSAQAFNLSITPIEKRPIIQFETSMGDIVIRLFPDEAPLTCKNFLSYVNDKFYDNTIIHRIIDGFIIQGGGFSPNYVAKPFKKAIRNESRLGLSNLKHTVAMALTTDQNSAASQFFFNLADNTDLDYSTKKGSGYTVFAEVIDGHKTLEKIQKIRTRKISIHSPLYNTKVPIYEAPEIEILIKSVRVLRKK